MGGRYSKMNGKKGQFDVRLTCHGSAMSGNDWDPHDDSRLNDGEFIDYEADVR